MSFLNKILKKSAKSDGRLAKKEEQKTHGKPETEAKKRDLTIAELKEQEAEKQVAKGKTVVVAAKEKEDTKNAYRILIRPMISEKGTYLAGQNKYLFEVAGTANKIEIKKAIKAVYGVDPVAVNVVNMPGKIVSYRRISGRTKARKKAIITLAKGQSIEVYEGV